MPLLLVVRISAVLFTSLFSCSVVASDRLVVTHYQSQARYVFGLNVLNLALGKVYGDYEVRSLNEEAVNEARGERLIIDGLLDLQFMSTTAYREANMIPIKIPIYRGMLGLRLLLVKPEINHKIKEVQQLEDLREYVGGHGALWGDLPVYPANNLPVIPVNQYNSIFSMLKEGRFDYFHRGVQEIWGELERYKQDLVVADNLILYYPLPVYFFIGKHRPELADALKQGLTLALNDGSYQELFDAHFSEMLDKAQVKQRRLIELSNPELPKDTPWIDRSWWMDSSSVIRASTSRQTASK